MTALGVITARGGSKGIPRKNLAVVLGKPLLAYTAEAALGARRLTRVVLTTDDEEIAERGRRCGLEVPFLRPEELARDDTPSLPVAQHAVRWLEERGDRFDSICLLEPTSPMRRGSDIDACLDLLDRGGYDAVASVLPVPHHYNPHWVYFRGPDGTLKLSTNEAAPIPRRQELPAAFHRDGSIYAVRRDVLMEGNSLYGERLAGYCMNPEESVTIDGPEDLLALERMLSARLVSG